MQPIKLLEACESVVESDPDMSFFFSSYRSGYRLNASYQARRV